MQIRARGAAEGPVILALTGEIDLANAAAVEAQLVNLVASTTGDVRLDCSGIEFIGSTGLDVLVGVHHALAQQQRRLILTRTTPWIRRLFDITAVDRIFIVEEPLGADARATR